MFVGYEPNEWAMHTCILCWTVPLICLWTAEQQSLQMSGLLPVIYGILNASVILERNEKHLEKTSYYLKRNETSYVRNDTSGGNFWEVLYFMGTCYSTSTELVYCCEREVKIVWFSFSSLQLGWLWCVPLLQEIISKAAFYHIPCR